MLNFEYCTPTRLIFGKGVVDKLPEVLASIGKKVLLTYGGGSIKKIGLYQKVKELLKDFEVIELSGIEPNPKYSTSVVEGVRLCKDNDINVILAVGGGSVLDCSKAIAAGARYEGETWDLITHKVPTKDALPVVDIITMAATGSEYDPSGVISRSETNDKVDYIDDNLYPVCSFIDPEYTFSVPRRQMVAGVADAINHVLEQYFVGESSLLTDGMCEACIKSLMENVKIALDNPEDYQARAEIFADATLACNGILSIGNSYSGWPMHGIEHALSAYYDITHGEGLAIITPRWMKHILNERTIERFVKYGINVFGIDKALPKEAIAQKTIDAQFAFFKSLGLPMHLREVGIDESRLEEMAKHIATKENLDAQYLFAPLKESDIVNILKESL